MRRAYVDTPNGQIHYREAGEGPPLVMIHQTADTGRMFTEVFPGLSARFRVLAPDTPGFGESDGYDAPPGIGGYRDFIGAYLDAMGVSRAHLLGHHSGAAFALAFAADHPERVSALILCGVPDFDPEKRPHTRPWLEPAALKPDGSHLASVWERITGRMGAWATDEQMHRSVVDTLQAMPHYHYAYRALRELDVEAAARKVSAPTLLLYGSEETYAGRQEELAPLFAAARTRRLDGVGATTMVQAPDAFVEAVTAFLPPP